MDLKDVESIIRGLKKASERKIKKSNLKLAFADNRIKKLEIQLRIKGINPHKGTDKFKL